MKAKTTRDIVAENLAAWMRSDTNLSSQPKLAAKSKVGQTTIGRILRKEVSASSENLRAIAEAFGRTLADLTSEIPTDANVSQAPSPARSFSYPEISEVQAGSPIEAIDLLQPGEGDRHNSDAWAGPHGFWLRVRGESMNRSSGVSFPEGMLILVHPLVEPVSGQFVVAKVDSDVTFKQYVVDAGVRLLKPLNPAYPVQVMDSRWQLVGTVVDAKWPRSAF